MSLQWGVCCLGSRMCDKERVAQGAPLVILGLASRVCVCVCVRVCHGHACHGPHVADLAGMEREVLVRALKVLESKGLVRWGSGWQAGVRQRLARVVGENAGWCNVCGAAACGV